MPNQVKNIDPRVIFTDLDGTLIDHNSYSFEPAKKFLKKLQQSDITVVPNTSKTLCEVKKHSIQMGLKGPIIVENGAGVYIPINWLPEQPLDTTVIDGYWVKSFSKERKYWLNVIDKLRPDFANCFESFSDMSVQRLVEVTGLTIADATLAKDRQYSEPLLWLGSDKQRTEFIERAKELGARPLLGGRFLHICGQSNKGLAMQWLVDSIQQQYRDISITSIALGDGGNDIDMLERADYACRIASPAHAYPKLQRTNNVFSSEAHGPSGWVELLQKIITH